MDVVVGMKHSLCPQVVAHTVKPLVSYKVHGHRHHYSHMYNTSFSTCGGEIWCTEVTIIANLLLTSVWRLSWWLRCF